MNTGTKSLIFGIHQVFIHPVVVYKAWKRLYGRPTWKEIICIIVHDWGYAGKPNLDGKEGTLHPELGANLAGRLLGKKYYDLCICHSRHYARILGKEPSKLCWADKYSFSMENREFYLFRARLSKELNELRETLARDGYVPITASDNEWYAYIKNYADNCMTHKSTTEFMHS